MPFDGTIDWPAALIALQKVGYEGTLMLELAGTDEPDRRSPAPVTRGRASSDIAGSWS